MTENTENQDERIELTPGERAWRRFKANRRGYWSLWIFSILFVLSLFAEVLSNDKPLIVHYDGGYYFPIFKFYSERQFGGDFDTEADYTDPYVKRLLRKGSNWVLYPLNHYSFNTINYFTMSPNPAPPSADNLLGTDDRGRDVFARLIYGFRLSVLFAFVLTAIGIVVGVVAGAVQGYFGGRIDLYMQRVLEVWQSMPELYLLIIFASIFQPSVLLLIVLLSLFGWMGLADYVRAEFLRGRNMDYVEAARALGVRRRAIMRRHLLPNSLTPLIVQGTLGIATAILDAAALSFLGLGAQPELPEWGVMLSAERNQVFTAPYLVFYPGLAIMITVLAFNLLGDGLRDALDPRLKNVR